MPGSAELLHKWFLFLFFLILIIPLEYVIFYKVKKLNSDMLNNSSHAIKLGKLGFQPRPIVTSNQLWPVDI